MHICPCASMHVCPCASMHICNPRDKTPFPSCTAVQTAQSLRPPLGFHSTWIPIDRLGSTSGSQSIDWDPNRQIGLSPAPSHFAFTSDCGCTQIRESDIVIIESSRHDLSPPREKQALGRVAVKPRLIAEYRRQARWWACALQGRAKLGLSGVHSMVAIAWRRYSP